MRTIADIISPFKSLVLFNKNNHIPLCSYSFLIANEKKFPFINNEKEKKYSDRVTGTRKFSGMPVKIFYAMAVCLLLLTGLLKAQAQSDYSVKSVTGSVSGTSTLHSWKSAITKVNFTGSVKSDGDVIASIKNVSVKIPVNGIISTEGKSMDKKTYKAFKSDKNPTIVYTFDDARVEESDVHVITIEATGKLSMAGMTLPETLSASGKKLADGDLEVTISKTLKMTSFNMKPPTALLGTIKSGDEITLNFTMILTHSKTYGAK